jgi:hypothetical protein
VRGLDAARSVPPDPLVGFGFSNNRHRQAAQRNKELAN